MTSAQPEDGFETDLEQVVLALDAASADDALTSVLALRPAPEVLIAAMAYVADNHDSRSADLGRLLAGTTQAALDRVHEYRREGREQALRILVQAVECVSVGQWSADQPGV